jgi:hypothetical protein
MVDETKVNKFSSLHSDRLTSIRDVAQTSQMRKKRSFWVRLGQRAIRSRLLPFLDDQIRWGCAKVDKQWLWQPGCRVTSACA